jgi:hypothetical protein
MGIRAIAAHLKLARGTGRRFARARDPEQLLVHNGTGYRDSILEEYKPYSTDGGTRAAATPPISTPS